MDEDCLYLQAFLLGKISSWAIDGLGLPDPCCFILSSHLRRLAHSVRVNSDCRKYIPNIGVTYNYMSRVWLYSLIIARNQGRVRCLGKCLLEEIRRSLEKRHWLRDHKSMPNGILLMQSKIFGQGQPVIWGMMYCLDQSEQGIAKILLVKLVTLVMAVRIQIIFVLKFHPSNQHDIGVRPQPWI